MRRHSWTNNGWLSISASPLLGHEHGILADMVENSGRPHESKTDSRTIALRTLAAISGGAWVSHFHLFLLPMLIPFLKVHRASAISSLASR